MYRWYRNAKVCFVYLADVEYSQRWKSSFRKSKWFTRGWTLQELLAPTQVEFYSKEGIYLGSKRSLEETIHEITGVDIDALRGQTLSGFSKQTRLLWAKERQTKREEDAAYSLFGIFGVYMPIIYGEGRASALRRLEDEINKRSPTLRVVNEGATSQQQRQAEDIRERRRDILRKSLEFTEMHARQAAIKTAHLRTCEWLLDQPEFADWVDAAKFHAHNGFLWIKAKPGAGKSTLMKFTFDRIRTTMMDCHVIGFFFNARGHSSEASSTLGAYRALLWQILNCLPEARANEVLDTVSPVMVDVDSRTLEYPWDICALQKLLFVATSNLTQPMYYFIDALDECDEQQIREMVEFLEHLCSQTARSGGSLRICLSSRHYPHVTIQREISLNLDGHHGHNRDIAVYIKSALKVDLDAEKLCAAIQARSSGVFMWVALVVAILNREYDHGRVHHLLECVERIPSGLHELFHDILTRDTDNRDETLRCIRWVLLSHRPLSPYELYRAILTGSKFDVSLAEDEHVRRFVLSCSKGLVEITQNQGSMGPKVQFIHESVREYLAEAAALRPIWPSIEEDNFEGYSHELLKISCLSYINGITDKETNLYDHIDHIEPQTGSTLHPLSCYALQSILYHAESAGRRGIPQQQFLLDFPLAKWIRHHRHCISHPFQPDTSLTYILAVWNLPTLIKMYPPSYACFSKGSCRDASCPMLVALRNRNIAAVKAFVAVHATYLEPGCALRQDCEQYTMRKSLDSPKEPPQIQSSASSTMWFDSRLNSDLHTIVEYGNGIVLRLALYAMRNGLYSLSGNTTCDTHKNTPLMLATTLSQPQILRILLESNEVDVNACDKMGWTALMWAAWRGDYEKVRDIIDYGFANPFIQDRYGRTARSLAQGSGYNNVVQLLVAAETTARASASAAERRKNLQKRAQRGPCEVIEISDED